MGTFRCQRLDADGSGTGWTRVEFRGETIVGTIP